FPDALTIAASYLKENPDTDVFYGQSVIIDDNFKFHGYHWAVEPPSDAILYGDPISQPSCFFRRSKYDEIGGLDIDLHYTMDWDLWVRFWRAGANFGYTDEVLSRVLWSEEAKTGGFGAARRRELRRIINQNPNLVRRLKSQVGFSLHHFLEYIFPASVSGRLRRARSDGRPGKNGITRSGAILGTGAMPVVNWGAEGVSKIVLSFDGDASKLDICAGDTNSTVNSPGDVMVELVNPLPPGQELIIKIYGRETSNPVYLKSIELKR
ncbi:MAG: hypothetical protein HKN14_12885, partial [Marinicaulis sp.]|nr:hypothetical protein [Marinicaulis sp.]